MRTATAILLLGSLTVLAIGCGDDDDSGSANTNGGTVSTSAPDVAGNTYIATAVNGATQVPDSVISVEFTKDGTVSANGGCNTMNGAYTIDGTTLKIPTLASTMMACEDALMTQEQMLSVLLTSSPQIVGTGDPNEIVISNKDISMTMSDKAVVDPATPLVGTTWNIDGTTTANSATAVPAGATPSFTINDDGTINVQSGCNTGSGKVTYTADTITFQPLALTRKACSDDLMALETTVTGVFVGDVAYTIDGNRITLTAANGTGVQAVAAA